MIVITGGLGFIGYNLIKKLNSMKINNIIIVDYKKKNFNSLTKIKYKKFIDVNTFYKNLKKKPEIPAAIRDKIITHSADDIKWLDLTFNTSLEKTWYK